MRLPIPDAVPVPKEVPFPSFSPLQWGVVGGAAVLGVAEVLSPPVALAVAAVPFVDRYLLHDREGDTARRSSGRRTRGAGSRRRSNARTSGTATARRRTTTAGSGRRGRRTST